MFESSDVKKMIANKYKKYNNLTELTDGRLKKIVKIIPDTKVSHEDGANDTKTVFELEDGRIIGVMHGGFFYTVPKFEDTPEKTIAGMDKLSMQTYSEKLLSGVILSLNDVYVDDDPKERDIYTLSKTV